MSVPTQASVYQNVANGEVELESGAENFISTHDGAGEFSVTRTPKSSSSVARSLLIQSPIKDNPAYHWAIQRERFIIIIILLIQVIFGPIVFRYCMGAQTIKNQEYPTVWGSYLDSFEIYFLLVIFANLVNFIFRMLPALCGKPATIESVKEKTLTGSAVLCVCSPFCSEADALLIRNMLGRTCTLFATVDSRHAIDGLYIDVTMNERRVSGEANRKNIFLHWTTFLTILIKLCQNRKGSVESTTVNAPGSVATSNGHSAVDLDASHEGFTHTVARNRLGSWVKYGESVLAAARSGGIDSVSGAVVIDANDEVKMRRVSDVPIDIDKLYPESTSIFETLTPMIPGEDRHVPKVRRSTINTHPGDKPAHEGIHDLVVDMETIQPVVGFLNHWLKNMKVHEKVYGYGENMR
jgi:hypothetical protein